MSGNKGVLKLVGLSYFISSIIISELRNRFIFDGSRSLAGNNDSECHSSALSSSSVIEPFTELRVDHLSAEVINSICHSSDESSSIAQCTQIQLDHHDDSIDFGCMNSEYFISRKHLSNQNCEISTLGTVAVAHHDLTFDLADQTEETFIIDMNI